jgi:hypothetical protein
VSSYYTLITALPWLPELEQCKQMPLSRIALDQRLTMLSDQDLEQLRLVESLYFPDSEFLQGNTDKQLVSVWREQLGGVESDTLLQRINFSHELMTLLAALRSRSGGMESPDLFHGIGRWLPRIKQHWFEPGFGLEDYFPQLSKIQRVLAKDDPALLEKVLNQMLWHDLILCERQNHFSFESVVCFVLRWGIAERHIQQDGTEALQKFNRLTGQLLGQAGLHQQLEQGVK